MGVLHSKEIELKWIFFTDAGAGVLRDRNDLKLLIGRTGEISDGLADQKAGHRRYEVNRTSLGIGFILSHDAICLYAPVVAPNVISGR